MARDNRWPRNEYVWNVSKIVGSLPATLPPDVLIPSITSVIHGGLQRLTYISHGKRRGHVVDEPLSDYW